VDDGRLHGRAPAQRPQPAPLALGVHVGALYLPATQFVLRVEPIDAAAWGSIVLASLSMILVNEAHKLLRTPTDDRRLSRARLRPALAPRPQPRRGHVGAGLSARRARPRRR
ncbi:MAG: hypothetical protein R6T85_10695, partial [Egibacteraceae bacterium]